MDFADCEKTIGVVFKNKQLLETAFTHRSYLNEDRRAGREHNERLEFLGDAVLELIITEYLFNRYPDKPEGDLTSYRASLVNAVTLANVAETIGMNPFMLLSHGEAKDTGRARQVILANAIEALIGALYIDQGYDVTKEFIKKHLFHLIDDIIAKKAWIDAKSLFQERAQEVYGITPSYTVIKEWGPDHDKHFLSSANIGDEKVAEGEGKSKQEAEQSAAEAGLIAKNWQ